MRMVVVLPAPFGPRKAWTSPAPTSRSRPSCARTLPYRLVSPAARNATVLMGLGGCRAGWRCGTCPLSREHGQSIHARLIAVRQQRYLPVVSVNHHRPGRILAPDDTESAAAGPGRGGHAQAVGTPSALGEPETHPGVGQHRHRQVAPCLIRDSGVERTHQPAGTQRDLHGAGLFRPDPLARLSDHTVDQLITPAAV